MAGPKRTIREIDFFIASYQWFLCVLPRSHPVRPGFIHMLALARFQRHGLSNQKDDLDKAILYLTELMPLQPWSRLEPESHILPMSFSLAITLYSRAIKFKQPEDAISAAKYLRHLRDQPHEVVGVPRYEVSSFLVDALAYQVELEAGNIMQNIGEMAVLCRELLTLDMSDSNIRTTHSIILLDGAVLSKIEEMVLDQPLDQIIECLRAARRHKPDLLMTRSALAWSLICRYSLTLEDDDSEEAASLLEEIITSSPPGNGRDEFIAKTQMLLITLVTVRSILHDASEYAEEAIYRALTVLGTSSVELPVRSDIVSKLELALSKRSHSFGFIEGPEASSDNSSSSPPVPVVSLGEYEGDGSEPGKMHEESEFFDILARLNGLRFEIRNNDITKIDEAIDKGRTILAAPSASRHPHASLCFESFCTSLFEAFKRTKKFEYLNESISTRRQILRRPFAQALHLETLSNLAGSLMALFVYFPDYRTGVQDEIVNLYSQCANHRYTSLHARFLYAVLWACFAHRAGHPSISTAYESAMSLMQDALPSAPTLQIQHAALASYNPIRSMPLDYASYLVGMGQLDKAVETLERGRALLWSEMRSLRVSVDQLLQADPRLGHEFAVASRDLEEVIKSITPSHKLSMDSSTADDLRAADPFGHFLWRQRTLVKERNKLILQIRATPGFDNFLTSPSFDALRSSASSGPVIIINHSQLGSDILIILHNTSPSLITTPRDFYDCACALKDKLLGARHKSGLDSKQYDETLASVLADLYKLIGEPVIDRLRQLKVPDQSRIWWCPTSVFCSLPLHAMGPIPSDEGEVHYFLDLYICSYTPTLSALIQSRHRDVGSRSSGRPSVLLVAQPDSSLPTVGGEIRVVQALDTKVTSLISEAATSAAVIDGFHHHQFVHFACHGTLEAGKPFEAGFELYGEERLSLLEIVRSHLPTAEFAFLSACHTAEVTEGSPVDEVLHLAAAVQYCGFRSVVGTMWAMVDEDGQDLAKYFYKALFSTSRGEQGILYHERSAKALQFAVKKLRRKRWISLENWVNYVHYGA